MYSHVCHRVCPQNGVVTMDICASRSCIEEKVAASRTCRSQDMREACMGRPIRVLRGGQHRQPRHRTLKERDKLCSR